MTRSLAESGFRIEPGREDDIDSLNASNLPDFMFWESPGNWAWGQLYDLYPRLQVVLRSPSGELLAAMNTVPTERCSVEPALGGYDEILVRATGSPPMDPDCLSLLSISVLGSARRLGLAERLICEAKTLARELGFGSVIGPLRPTRKHLYPLTPIGEYARWQRPDGTAFDPWLRLHLRIGGEIVGVAPRSLVIEQPVARWEAATGLAMPGNGSYVVPLALVPIEVVDGIGTYVEPNIWISHTV